MGIKFYCPNGHKVNVKSFLAGKKGLCPKCGVRVDIPLESVADDRPKATSNAGLATAIADDDDEADDTEAVTAQPANAQANSSGGQPVSSATIPVAKRPPDGVPSSTGYPPASNGSAVTSSPIDIGLSLEKLRPAAKLPESSGALVPVSEEPAEFNPEPSDTWHLQSANGQQFEVEEATLNRWLSEGRIAFNDLLWREGWPQWQSAKSVFPQSFGIQTAPQPLQSAPAASPVDDPVADAVRAVSSPAVSSSAWLRQRHRGKREIRATLSLVLLGLVVLLFALLLYVFFVRQQPDSNQSSLSKGESSFAPVFSPRC